MLYSIPPGAFCLGISLRLVEKTDQLLLGCFIVAAPNGDPLSVFQNQTFPVELGNPPHIDQVAVVAPAEPFFGEKGLHIRQADVEGLFSVFQLGHRQVVPALHIPEFVQRQDNDPRAGSDRHGIRLMMEPQVSLQCTGQLFQTDRLEQILDRPDLIAVP